MAKILNDEKKRQEKINKLTNEMHGLLEMQDDMCDTDRIDEIIYELNIIDPLPESNDNTNIKNSELIKNSKAKRRFMLLKVSVACFIFLLSVQTISFIVFGVNLYGWTRDSFLAMIGVETRLDDLTHTASGSRQYNTIEEFEAAENMKILSPYWLLEEIEVELIEYGYVLTAKPILGGLYHSYRKVA